MNSLRSFTANSIRWPYPPAGTSLYLHWTLWPVPFLVLINSAELSGPALALPMALVQCTGLALVMGVHAAVFAALSHRQQPQHLILILFPFGPVRATRPAAASAATVLTDLAPVLATLALGGVLFLTQLPALELTGSTITSYGLFLLLPIYPLPGGHVLLTWLRIHRPTLTHLEPVALQIARPVAGLLFLAALLSLNLALAYSTAVLWFVCHMTLLPFSSFDGAWRVTRMWLHTQWAFLRHLAGLTPLVVAFFVAAQPTHAATFARSTEPRTPAAYPRAANRTPKPPDNTDSLAPRLTLPPAVHMGLYPIDPNQVPPARHAWPDSWPQTVLAETTCILSTILAALFGIAVAWPAQTRRPVTSWIIPWRPTPLGETPVAQDTNAPATATANDAKLDLTTVAIPEITPPAPPSPKSLPVVVEPISPRAPLRPENVERRVVAPELLLSRLIGAANRSLPTHLSGPVRLTPHRIGASSIQGPVRSRNEDFALAFEVGAHQVTILADGVGGEPYGSAASYLAVRNAAWSILRQLAQPSATSTPPQTLAAQALNDASRSIERVAAACGLLSGFRTTLIVVLASADQYGYAYIGDGHGSVLRTDGTQDVFLVPHHLPDGPSNIVAACLGPTLLGAPSVGTAARQPDDLLILGTDGVFGQSVDLGQEFPERLRAAAHHFGGDLQRTTRHVLQELSTTRDELGFLFDDNLSLILATQGLPNAGTDQVHARLASVHTAP